MIGLPEVGFDSLTVSVVKGFLSSIFSELEHISTNCPSVFVIPSARTVEIVGNNLLSHQFCCDGFVLEASALSDTLSSSVCNRMWTSSLDIMGNFLRHTEHSNGSSPCCV